MNQLLSEHGRWFIILYKPCPSNCALLVTWSHGQQKQFPYIAALEKSLEQKEKTTGNKQRVSVVNRCTYIKMSNVKKKIKMSSVALHQQWGRQLLFFFLDLWQNGIFTPSICKFFYLAWKWSTFFSCNVIFLSFTAGRRRKEKIKSLFTWQNPLLLFWISVNYQWANQLTPQPKSFL